MKHKKITAFLLAIVIALSFSGCVKVEIDRSGNNQNDTEITIESANNTEYEDEDMSFDGSIDALKILSDDELEIYNTIADKLNQESFTIENGDPDKIISVIRKISNDYPQYFWLTGKIGYHIVTKSNGEKKTTIEFCNYDKKIYNKIIEEAEKVASKARGLGSAYEKALYVHDYLVNTIEYDQETYEYNTKHPTSDKIKTASTAYGALVEHKAVCSGYSSAFAIIMQQLNIKCGSVIGQKIGGGNHQWNYIVLGGEYYYIDVTWDDPITDNSGQNLTHEYFCIDDETLLINHKISDNQFVPSCTSKYYEYYHQNGLYLESYNYDDIKEIILDSIDKGKVEIRFSSSDEVDKAIEELVKNSKIFDIIGNGKKVSYSIGETRTVISFSFINV